ncbi:DNA-3-methyladenine glycosylase [Paenibacillus sp. LHD-117]|uniref:DNA-3-methyladenine glycosylase family protein n=1 Tax=Paenibacillus sp. LHD-117 TaxID=3071412 RepID=UPI0027E09E85|nr:DNA-3-methyladenine glycosylase [Paenibacillus sp. LHD-117]MDQ6419794.1 DNA-3-methyladenine glycosylase [Paenibacillus sp. LHD-117]
METVTLPVPKAFDFGQHLAYLKRSSNECLFRVEGDAVYKAMTDGRFAAVWKVSEDESGGLKLERLSEPVRIERVRAAGLTEPVSGHVHAFAEPKTVLAPSALTPLTAAAVAYTREWFDLDRDLTPFYELAEGDPLLKEPAARFRGLRLLGIPDLFEALCWGIIGQQINLAFAYTLKRRLVERYGESIEHGGESYWLFPSPETIAELTIEELDPLRMTARKSEYLIDTAAAVASGELTKEHLLSAGGLKEAERLLVSRRGIGPWTAHYVIMRCLRFPDAFPIDDVGLHNAIKSLTGLDRKPTKAELLEMSAGWTSWEAYATFYLWRLLY